MDQCSPMDRSADSGSVQPDRPVARPDAKLLSSLAQAVAICAGALLFAGNAAAAGDKSTYEQDKALAKTAYETDKKACDSLKGNANDICVAEAKAKPGLLNEWQLLESGRNPRLVAV